MLGILAEGSAAASGLADRLAVRRPSITALIDGLVARGLVDRRQEDTDRRRVALRLTTEGERTLAEADRAVDDYLVSIAGHLPDKDEAMALRSLELWARAMAESRQGPRQAAEQAGGGRCPMSKTEDRLDGEAAGDGGRRATAGRDRGGGHRGATCARLPAGGLRPHGGHEPLRGAQGDASTPTGPRRGSSGRRRSSWRTRCSSSAR